MNIFRNLIGRVFQDPNAAEVVKISSGSLDLVREAGIRSSRERIFNEAMATIRRVPGSEHSFELVITKVYEEGDQELLEEQDETDTERVFAINVDLEFRVAEADGEPALVWRDLDGGEDELFQFVVARSTNAPTIAFFETCAYRAMYEKKYRRNAEEDTEMDEFVWHPPEQKKASAKSKRAASTRKATKAEDAGLAVALGGLSVAGSSAHADADTKGKSKSKSKVKAEETTSSPALILAEEDAELWLWSFAESSFVLQGPVRARLVCSRSVEFESFLVADTEKGPHLYRRVEAEMNHRWQSRLLALTWTSRNDPPGLLETANGELPSTWLLRFPGNAAYAAFQDAFVRALWEKVHGRSWAEAKPDEQQYVQQAWGDEDVEMANPEDDEEEEADVASALDRGSDESEEEEEEEEESESDDEPRALPRSSRNSLLTTGYKGGRAYVVRGNNIGVFDDPQSGAKMKYHASISRITAPGVRDPELAAFEPSQVMLHQQDSKMVLMHPRNKGTLYSMDIERGKIVEEWSLGEGFAVSGIAPESKFAQTTPEQTLVATAPGALFRVDPRLPGSKLARAETKQYASSQRFAGLTTTERGGLAVASEKGDIRLFDSVGKNAKTALPALGDPILGIDVTADGRWIVATTKTYLLLIDALIGQGKFEGQLGFDRSFPATSKPQPKRLQLKAEHVVYMGREISFTTARFNLGPDKEETTIVTSTGQFVIAWDFNKVIKGKLDAYEIKKYEDRVVQDNFRFNNDEEIVVALQNDVLKVNKANLKRPTAKTLTTPTKQTRGKVKKEY